MNRVLKLLLICVFAAGVVLSGCDKKEDKKPSAGNRSRRTPRSRTPSRRAARKPPRRTRTDPPDDMEFPMEIDPEVDAGPPPDRRGPRRTARGALVESTWGKAKVGTTVKIRDVRGFVVTYKVVEVDEKEVVVDITTTGPGIETKTQKMVRPRHVGRREYSSQLAKCGRRTGRKTIKISGKEYHCEIRRKSIEEGGETMTRLMYFCKDVPGGLVRHERGRRNDMQTISEVIAFRE